MTNMTDERPVDEPKDGQSQRVVRVLRVQLAPLADAEWTALRALAREGAQFANACLADSYARALGYHPPDGLSVFRRAKGSLSGDVRVALAREAWTAWRRHGGKILAGAQRLALFDADRVLVCRAEHLSKGRRQIHARIEHMTDGLRLGLRLTARLVGKHVGGQHVFELWPHPKADAYVRPVLDAMAAGQTRLLKITFAFERPGRKVFALLTYERWIAPAIAGAGVATLGPLEADGSLWLRWEDASGRAQTRNYTQDIARLAHMKEHFQEIRDRLRQRLRRSGPGAKRAYWEALVKAGSFGAWVRGPLHQLSADIVMTARRHQCGSLAIGPLEYQDLPMAALVTQLEYKSREAGLVLSRFDVAATSTARAVVRPIAKQRRSIVKQREAWRILRAGLAQ